MTKRWSNKDNTLHGTPLDILYPSTREELQAIILQAKQKNIKVKAVGSAHSWSPIAITEGYCINTDKLNKVLIIDKKNLCARVEGGIKLHDLLDALFQEGLTLPNQGFIREQSIAGVVATATHGTGPTSTFSDFVQEIELLTSDGQFLFLSNSEDPEAFAAASMNLGCLGVVYALTLKCVPIHKLQTKTKIIDWSEVVTWYRDKLAKKDFDHVEIVCNPYNNKALFIEWIHTEEKPRNYLLLRAKKKLKIGTFLGNAMAILVRRFPFLFPKITQYVLEFYRQNDVVDYSHRILSPEDMPLNIQTEIALPVESLEEVMFDIKAFIREESAKGHFITAAIGIRFVQSDKYALLSPSLGQPKIYIELNSCYMAGHLEFFRRFHMLMEKYGGKPHWGKIHFLTKDKVESLYGSNYHRFVKVKNRLDPIQMFSNEFCKSIFE